MDDDKAARRAKAIRLSKRGAIAAVVGFFGTGFYPVEWMAPPSLATIPLLFLNLAMYVGPVVLLVGSIKLACTRL